jgi:hypothetical protein
MARVKYLENCSYVFCQLPNTAGLAIYITNAPAEIKLLPPEVA